MSESKQLSPVQLFTRTLDAPTLQQQISKALPPGVNMERFISTAKTAIANNPKLLDLDRPSLYNAFVRAAQDGLSPDGREGAIIAYGDKAAWMPMIYGVIQQLGKAGITAHAKSVFKGEDVEIWSDEQGQHIKHVQNPFAESREMIGVYAVGITSKGQTYIEAMNMADINAVRAKSKNPGKGPWADSFDRMAQKSALHRLAKRMPIIDENQREVVDKVLKSVEDDFDYGSSPPAPTLPAEQKRPAALQAVIDQSTPAATDSTDADII